MRYRWFLGGLACVFLLTALASAEPSIEGRKPATDEELKYWLENMAWWHQFTLPEMAAATGLPEADLAAALAKWNLRRETRPARPADAPLWVLPYPGGRHPRAGFLEGAVRPQRETKLSILLPWEESGYVVADVPEALWSNLGLTYLAHTHVPTVWSKEKIELPPQEWNRRANGTYDIERKLPNGLVFGTSAMPQREGVRWEMWLSNGTSAALTDLRVQNFLMLKAAIGFAEPTNDNKVFQKPFTAVRNREGNRWIIWAWSPCQRAWGNAPVPCLHSDPQFPDCPAGETRRLRGWLSFYSGTHITDELKRLEGVAWK